MLRGQQIHTDGCICCPLSMKPIAAGQRAGWRAARLHNVEHERPSFVEPVQGCVTFFRCLCGEGTIVCRSLSRVLPSDFTVLSGVPDVERRCRSAGLATGSPARSVNWAGGARLYAVPPLPAEDEFPAGGPEHQPQCGQSEIRPRPRASVAPLRAAVAGQAVPARPLNAPPPCSATPPCNADERASQRAGNAGYLPIQVRIDSRAVCEHQVRQAWVN